MKNKILQILFMLLMVKTSTAGIGNSIIHLSHSNNELITVVFDGIQYPGPVRDFSLSGITSGQHHLKVLINESAGWNYPAYSRMVFNGAVTLNPGEEIFARVDNNGRIHLRHVLNFQNGLSACVVPAPVNQYAGACTSGAHFSAGHCTENNAWISIPVAMCRENYLSLKQSITNLWFDSSKSDAAQMALKHNYLTAEQIAGIMNLFDFESTRLEFAKKAYSRCVDQHNYWLVNEAFSFSSSVNNLQQYIGY